MTKESRQQTVDSYQQSAVSYQLSVISSQHPYLLATSYWLLNKRGFTLLEIVVVLAITGLLAGGLATVGHQVIKKEWEDKTTEHMKRLKVAVVGDPLDVRHGIRTSFGYFGDMGVLPSTLQNLYILGAQTPYNPATLPTSNAAAGWNGPYLAPEIIEYLGNLDQDYFRQDLQYTSPASFATYTDSTVGVSVEERIASSGRDKQAGTIANPGDDLAVVFFNNELYSQVSGFIRDPAGNGVSGVPVAINYASNGTLTTSSPVNTGTTPAGSYSLPSVPYGNHSLSITNPKLFLAPGTGQTSGGFGNDVSFIIVNTGGSVTLTSLSVSYSMNPTTYYEKVYVGTNATAVYTYTTNRIASGTTLTFAGQTINAATDLAEPVAVCVQSPVTAVPDIPLTRLGRGSATEIILTDFTDLQTGSVPDVNKINMIGVVFTITLTLSTGSSSTVYFIP